MILPFWSNFLIRVYAWMILLGPQGYLAQGLNGLLGLAGIAPVRLLYTPIAIPEVLQGVSLLIFFVMLKLTLGLVSIVLAHIAFCIGFVAVVVRARLQGLDESLIEAARDLGATPWRAFWRITLPLIAPGIVAGALMAFTLSIDDFVITSFTAGAEASTLPLQIYSMLRIAVTPEVNAISTLLMALTLALVLIAYRVAPGLPGGD